jgi:outer membrane protein assembly factor BamB
LPAPPVAAPGFDSTRIFVPLPDQLVAASLAAGQLLWTIDLPSPSTPTTGDRRVFVVSGERLMAVSPDDGSTVWEFRIGARLSAPLRWDAGWLFAGTENAELFALRAIDGQLQWRRLLGSALSAAAVPAGERVYVSLQNGQVEALDIHTGETLWVRPLNGTPTEILALDDRIFVGSRDNFFYCLDPVTGNVRWRWRTGADIIGNAVVDDGRVYFISLDNVLRALHRRRGGLEWHRGLPMRASSGPIMLEDLLIVPGVAAEFTAFSMRDGVYAGSYRAAADLAAPPHLHVNPMVEGGAIARLSPITPAVQEPRPRAPDAPPASLSSVQQLIVITREGGLEALVRVPPPPPPASVGPQAPNAAPGTSPGAVPESQPPADAAPAPAAPSPPPPTTGGVG